MQKKQSKMLKNYILALAFISVLLLPLHNIFALTLTPIRIEVAGDPGQTLNEEMTLINELNTPETYYSSYANFEAQGETGSPTFVPAKDDLGTWMSAPTSVTLPAKGSKIIKINISIPANADAGGHFAAIFWGTTPNNSNGGTVAIGAKTGMLVLLRVNGNVSEKGGILDFATQNKQTYFTSLPISFYYRFQNAGGDRIKPAGEVLMKDTIGITGAKISGNPVEGNILPNSVRKFETVWQGADGPTPLAEKDRGNFFNKVAYEWHNFAFGHYNAKLNLSYGTKGEVATAVFSFWVFPWHLTIFSIIVLILAFFIGRGGIRKYNQWVISKARAMLQHENSMKTHDGYHSH